MICKGKFTKNMKMGGRVWYEQLDSVIYALRTSTIDVRYRDSVVYYLYNHVCMHIFISMSQALTEQDSKI